MNQEQAVQKNRENADQRNSDLRKQSADRLRRNAEWNRANKPKKRKE